MHININTILRQTKHDFTRLRCYRQADEITEINRKIGYKNIRYTQFNIHKCKNYTNKLIKNVW